MKRVLWVILGIAFASFLYAGKPQKQQQPRMQPTPTPATQKKAIIQNIRAREVAPTAIPERKHIAYSDDPRKEVATTPTPVADIKHTTILTGAEGQAGVVGPVEKGKGKMPAYDKEITPTTCCQDWNNNGECIKWGPTSGGCPSAPRLRKSQGHEGTVDKTTTVNTTKSNSYKEIAPTVTPAVGKVMKGAIQGLNKEAAPTNPEPTPTVTPGQAGSTTVKGSKSNGSFRSGEVEPTPTSEPVGATTVKSTKSNGSERSSGHAVE